MDWPSVPDHDLLLASPACQGHSIARGRNRHHHDGCRSTAWAVVSCAEVHRPRWVVVENVPEFAMLELFPAWRQALQALGYAVSENVIDAADVGVPQHRRRLFVIGSRDGRGRTVSVAGRDHKAARTIIGKIPALTPVGSLCARTRDRIQRGRLIHGRLFLVPYYGSARGGRSLDMPLGTVTTRDRYALVDGDRMRMLTVDEYRLAMGFPDSYVLPERRSLAIHLLGNAVCPPVAAEVIRQVVA